MFTVTGTSRDKPALATNCNTYSDAIRAAKAAEADGYQGVRIGRAHPDTAVEPALRAALGQMLLTDTATAVTNSEAFGALLYHVREHTDLFGCTPLETLQKLSDDALWFAGQADEPAAYLAARIRDLG